MEYNSLSLVARTMSTCKLHCQSSNDRNVLSRNCWWAAATPLSLSTSGLILFKFSLTSLADSTKVRMSMSINVASELSDMAACEYTTNSGGNARSGSATLLKTLATALSQ